MTALAAAATLEDVLAAARLIGRFEATGAGPAAREALARAVLARARVAATYRRRCAAAHPVFGDGSVTAAAASVGRDLDLPERGCCGWPATMRGAALICALLGADVDTS